VARGKRKCAVCAEKVEHAETARETSHPRHDSEHDLAGSSSFNVNGEGRKIRGFRPFSTVFSERYLTSGPMHD
jgi:hypothetical protein